MPCVPDLLDSLASQREAIRQSLVEFLKRDDNAMLAEYACGEFARRVVDLCRPALVSPKGWMTAYKGWEPGPSDERLLVALSVDDLLETAAALQPQGELLLCDVSPLRGQSVALTVEYGDSLHADALIARSGMAQSVSLLREFDARMTIPSVETLFPGFQEVSLSDTWYWGRLDLYEKWAWSCYPFNAPRGTPYVQVGGYGQFVQTGDDAEFVAQVNNEVGDCGSTYLLYREPDGFFADIQMA